MSDDLIEEKFKVQEEKIVNHEDRITNLEKTYIIMAKMETTLKNVQTDISDMKDKINKTTEEKAFKWDKLIDYLFYAILAYCLYKLGIKK